MNGGTRSDILFAGGTAILMVVMSASILRDTNPTGMVVLIVVGAIISIGGVVWRLRRIQKRQG